MTQSAPSRARVALDAAIAAADAAGVAVSIAVVDAGGILTAFQRHEAVHPGTTEVAMAKARCAALFRRPTSAFARALRDGDLIMLTLPGVLAAPGGVPIRVGQEIWGAVGVSGGPPEVDERIAEAAAAALAQ